MNFGLDDKNVLITGGTGGIGSQIVADFLDEGAAVICLIRSDKKFNELKGILKEQGVSGVKLQSYKCDLLNPGEIKAVVQTILTSFKKIDVLVSCTGLVHEYPFALLDEKKIDEMIDLNFKSPLYLILALIKSMIIHKGGSIILISSASAIKKGRGIATYAATKAGLDAFSRGLSQEVGRKNIRINTIRPGVIDTSMSKGLQDRSEDRAKALIALGRFGQAKEISKTVLFLASDNMTSYMTGESITIDGGLY